VNGAVQNFEEFGKAFQCAKGKPMYPEKSCRVW
jgi:putative endopeptidase